MTCVIDRYPRTKVRTSVILKNYYVSKQTARTGSVKEEVASTQTYGEENTNKKGEYNCFYLCNPNHREYECPQLPETEKSEIRTTKEKCGYNHAQVSDVIEEHIHLEDGISMLVNQNEKQRDKTHPTQINLKKSSTYNQMFNEGILLDIKEGNI